MGAGVRLSRCFRSSQSEQNSAEALREEIRERNIPSPHSLLKLWVDIEIGRPRSDGSEETHGARCRVEELLVAERWAETWSRLFDQCHAPWPAQPMTQRLLTFSRAKRYIRISLPRVRTMRPKFGLSSGCFGPAVDKLLARGIGNMGMASGVRPSQLVTTELILNCPPHSKGHVDAACDPNITQIVERG